MPTVIDPVTGQPKRTITPGETPWIGSQQQVADTTAGKVAEYAAKESPLNQMARTEGLKVANRRGLLNSSMAVGAAQDAVLQNVLPIASQDAAQAFQKNQAAKAFEYGMTAQEGTQEWQTKENIAQRGFLTSERLGTQAFTTAERLGTETFERGENIASRAWQSAENIAQRNFLGTQADLDRDLQQALQTQQLTVQQAMQVRQIASTEGIEAANRAMANHMNERDLAVRMHEGNLDRASAERQQAADIAFRRNEGAAQRALEREIATWNLSSNDRNAAAQMISNMEANYQNQYNTIMSNPRLNATQRAQQLQAAANLRSTQLNTVRQIYNVNFTW